MSANRYSATWFELFLQPVPPAQTQAEIAFVARRLPLPEYRVLLDLCCGPGRHAAALARLGYAVTGLDWNAEAIALGRALARETSSDVRYVEGDMRRLDALPGTFDGVVNLWQSFGYFDDATNADVLRQIHARLNARGRLVLDLYHRGYFERNEGMRMLHVGGISVTENRFMRGDRLCVTLEYAGREPDVFEWRLYTPEEIAALAGAAGFELLAACSGFDEARPPAAEAARMQFVFVKRPEA